MNCVFCWFYFFVVINNWFIYFEIIKVIIVFVIIKRNIIFFLLKRKDLYFMSFVVEGIKNNGKNMINFFVFNLNYFNGKMWVERSRNSINIFIKFFGIDRWNIFWIYVFIRLNIYSMFIWSKSVMYFIFFFYFIIIYLYYEILFSVLVNCLILSWICFIFVLLNVNCIYLFFEFKILFGINVILFCIDLFNKWYLLNFFFILYYICILFFGMKYLIWFFNVFLSFVINIFFFCFNCLWSIVICLWKFFDFKNWFVIYCVNILWLKLICCFVFVKCLIICVGLIIYLICNFDVIIFDNEFI